MVLLGSSLVGRRQAPLRARYRRDPEQATIVKRAGTHAGQGADALHGLVAPDRSYGVSWPYGIDQAVGGLHDVPNPGELLCAALAACQDAAVRMVADLLVEGVFDGATRQRIVRDLTEAMVAIEGENMRPVTWVLVEELKSGDWGIAGNPLTTADVKALAAGSPVA